ncbi:MAG: S-layer homology domain-containing protein [Patescibacteria group bacterium]
MKKLLQKLVLLVTVFSVIGQTALAEGFKDLNTTHANYNAIIYLQNEGILNGYPDGTFKPDKSVNRAEFLKIILEGSNISTDTEIPAPFADIDQTAWYGPYVNKAFDEGWINGYPDGTFGPDKTINKAEALKILGKVQGWNISTELSTSPFTDVNTTEWFAPYAIYAKENQYITSTNGLFIGSTLMTRGSMSQVIFNTLTITELADSEDSTDSVDSIDSTDEIIEDETPVTDFEATDFKTISTSFYQGLTLSEELPTIFYKNEVYLIEGTVQNAATSGTTVIIDSEDGSSHESFFAPLEGNSFSVPVHFRNSGNYQIGIIPGESGKTKASEISVLATLPIASNASELAEKATGIDINFAQDQTSVEFSSQTSTLKKLTFTQGSKTVTYLSRQDTNYMPIDYKSFKNFQEGQTSYRIETAQLKSQKPLLIDSDFTSSDTDSFTAAEHTFDYIEDTITANAPDLISQNSEINISGKVKTDAKIDILITKPDGFVESSTLSSNAQKETYFNQQIIKSGSDFSLTYKPKTSGRYIVEINNKNSEPIFNHPVYVGDAIPLIPDFFDLNQRDFFKGTLDVNSAREQLLNLINQERQQHGLKTIILSDELNNLAQAHSVDMKVNNFFGHYNKLNQTPNDRRLAAGIQTPVGENIAKDTTVTFGHYGLMRSGSHRKNILTEDWTKVGLGIVEDDGYLLITEEFSTSPLTSENLVTYKNQLLDKINAQRQNEGKTSLNYSFEIQNASIDLNDKVIDQKATLNNSDFTSALTKYGINGNSQLVGRNGSSWQSILNSIIADGQDNIFESMWETIGVDIQTDQTGNLNAIVIINDDN